MTFEIVEIKRRRFKGRKKREKESYKPCRPTGFSYGKMGEFSLGPRHRVISANF